jgi:hypothetical protein
VESQIENPSHSLKDSGEPSAPAEASELPELGHPPTPMWTVWGTLVVLVASGVIGLASGLRGPAPVETLSVAPAAPTATTAPTASSSARPNGPTVLRTIQARQLVVKYAGAQGAGETITRGREEARKRAEELLARVKKGEEIAALAAEFSDDPATSQKNGDLGWIQERKAGPELWKGLNPLEDGEISGIIETPQGFHIAQRTK